MEDAIRRAEDEIFPREPPVRVAQQSFERRISFG